MRPAGVLQRLCHKRWSKSLEDRLLPLERRGCAQTRTHPAGVLFEGSEPASAMTLRARPNRLLRRSGRQQFSKHWQLKVDALRGTPTPSPPDGFRQLPLPKAQTTSQAASEGSDSFSFRRFRQLLVPNRCPTGSDFGSGSCRRRPTSSDNFRCQSPNPSRRRSCPFSGSDSAPFRQSQPFVPRAVRAAVFCNRRPFQACSHLSERQSAAIAAAAAAAAFDQLLQHLQQIYD